MSSDLRKRLENWARCMREGNHQNISATGRFCEELAKGAGQVGYRDASDAVPPDELDAEIIEAAWKQQSPLHKNLLKWLYIRNAPPEFICRRFGIKPRPRTVFDIERSRAERAIEKTLDTFSGIRNIRDYNSIPAARQSEATKGGAVSRQTADVD